MSMRELQKTIEAVQNNCHIADARHAREMSMCNYLLGMRELYIWEHEFPPSRPPVKEHLSRWLTQREMFWEDYEERDYQPIPIGNVLFDPFDIHGINQLLEQNGMVYGGGLGRWGKPNFFLGQLLRSETIQGVTLRVAGCEYARDINSVPAAYRDGVMFLRTDAVQRWLAEKVEIWSAQEADGALKMAVACYGGHEDKDRLLSRMVQQESEILIRHEIGEAMADPLLGPEWRDMLHSFSNRRVITLVRSVRDNLADCLSTLPYLLENRLTCSLHFYFSNLDGLRRILFPSLVSAYEHWCVTGDVAFLGQVILQGQIHWQQAGRRLLAQWHTDPVAAQSIIDQWIEQPVEISM